MWFKRLLFLTLLFWNALLLSGQSVFINEVDYLLPDLCIEIVSPPGADLTDWFVTTYDENAEADDTVSLTGVPPSEITPTGFNIIEVDIVFLSPTTGGMALVDNNNQVVQFISYNEVLTAVDGPAAGQMSENIGTQTASGNSHQLEGIGSHYEDFIWNVPGDSNCGMENDNQELIEDIPLPVDFLSFNAKQKEAAIELSWVTATEINNDHFIIEKRSATSIETILAIIPGQGNSTTIQNYSYYDVRPEIGENYYRLIQVDLNGNRQFTEWINVDFNNNLSDILLYPNPVLDELNITVPDIEGRVRLSIYNMLGQSILILENEDNFTEPILINTKDFNSGQYLIVLEIGGKTYRQLFIKY